MKKLNRKGFTLIELLAVIVLLAILMVVAMPYVFDALGNATGKSFKNSADAIAKYVNEAYSLAVIGETGTSVDTFLGVCDRTTSKLCTVETKKTSSDATKGFVKDTTADKTMYDFLSIAKQDPTNYKSVSIQINANTGKICVKIEPSGNGDFASVDASKFGQSNGCN